MRSLIITLALCATTFAQVCDDLREYVVPSAQNGASIGTSVASNGTVAVVGAPYANAGAAFVFDLASGDELFKLTASDGGPLDEFGSAVAIHGNVAAVGATRVNTGGSGAVYLFDVTTGLQIDKLVPQPAPATNSFGAAIAMNGDHIVIGAPGDDDVAFNAGAAYVFDATTGTQLFKLKVGPFDPVTNFFGRSLSLDGTRVAIGSPRDNGGRGSVFLYDVTTGEQIDKFTPPAAGGSTPELGASVALLGTTLFAGATLDPGNGEVSGAAYKFDTTTGLEVGKLTPDIENGFGFDAFGASIAYDGTAVVVGAPGNNFFAKGTAFWFDAATLDQVSKLTPSLFGSANNRAGRSVTIANGVAVVGASGHQNFQPGAAYSFDVASGACWTAGFPSGPLGENGYVLLGGAGALSGGNTISLDITGAAAAAPTWLIIGASEALVPFKGGTLVPTPDAVIGPLITDAAGELELAGTYPVTFPPATLFFQAWVVDATGNHGFAGSPGLTGTTLF